MGLELPVSIIIALIFAPPREVMGVFFHELKAIGVDNGHDPYIKLIDHFPYYFIFMIPGQQRFCNAHAHTESEGLARMMQPGKQVGTLILINSRVAAYFNGPNGYLLEGAHADLIQARTLGILRLQLSHRLVQVR